MKKLTSLQILMLMGLAVGSSNMYGSDQDAQAVQLELQVVQDEQATAEVLGDLAQSDPAMAERIINDESDLEATFASIRKFVDKKNKEIESLLKAKSVDEEEVARLAVELADAQAALEKAQARQNAKHKKPFHGMQVIKDSLMKCEQGLKKLSKSAGKGLQQASKAVAKSVKPAKKAKKAAPKKAVSMNEVAPMNDDMAMMNEQASDEVVTQAAGTHTKGGAKKHHKKS